MAGAADERTLLNLTHETIIVRKPDSTIIFWNKGAEEMYGWTSEEILGQVTHVLLKTEFPVSQQAVEQELLKTGRWEGDLGHTRRDGGHLTVSSRQVLQRDSQGHASAILEINTDITERKKDEEQIRALNSRLAELLAARTAGEQQMKVRLAAIVESSEDAIISMSIDGEIESWNPAAEHLFGYSEEEVIGKSVLVIYPPERKEEFPRIMARLQRGERIEHYETVRVRKDGTRFDASISISPTRDVNDRITGSAKIIRNISAEKRMREAERFLAEASVALAGSLDYTATLEKVARLAVPFLADYCLVQAENQGVPLNQDAVAAANPKEEDALRELVHNRPPNAAAEPVKHVLETAEPLVAWRVTDDFLARLTAAPYLSQMVKAFNLRSYMALPMVARGRTIGLLHIGMAKSGRNYDPLSEAVGEELAARAALAIDNAGLYQESQAAVVARDQFLSVASHEVRTPLTIVQGYAELIRRQAERAARDGEDRIVLDRPRLIRSIANIEAAAERLRALIADLLEVSTMRDQSMTLSRERADLSRIVDHSLEEIRRQQAYHDHLQQLQILVDLPGEPLWGYWDSRRLKQVLVNLLSNAVKYSMPGGTIRIRLGVERDAEQVEFAHLQISDEGIGIPSSEVQGLFEPFTRTSTAVARHYPGLGLGLAVSREVISRHGGRIWVDSKGVDQGSTFHVALPTATPGA